MITVAKNAGFCFGVRRATDTIEELIRNKTQGDVICTLGKLIHNDQYNDFLKENGVFVIDIDGADALLEKAKEGKRVTIVTRAHGIEDDIQKKLQKSTERSENFSFIDCTCPYVKKIHKIAQENSQKNQTFILIGQSEHPEVKSIMSYVKHDGYVFGSSNELENFLKEHLGTVRTIEMDCEKLTYVSSAGLRVLLSIHKRLMGSVTLTNVCELVMEIFEITGFIDVLTIK